MLNMFKSIINLISVLSVLLCNPYLTTFNPTYFSIIVRNTQDDYLKDKNFISSLLCISVQVYSEFYTFLHFFLYLSYIQSQLKRLFRNESLRWPMLPHIKGAFIIICSNYVMPWTSVMVLQVAGVDSGDSIFFILCTRAYINPITLLPKGQIPHFITVCQVQHVQILGWVFQGKNTKTKQERKHSVIFLALFCREEEKVIVKLIHLCLCF